jgi:hypothetical protein
MAMSLIAGLEKSSMADRTMTDIALLPCPFCGGKAKIIGGDESAYVQCVEMKMHRALWFDGDNNASGEVAEQWNRRASPSQVALANPAQGAEQTWQKPGERAAQGTPADEQSGETGHVASPVQVTDADSTARLREIAVEVFPSANKLAVAEGVKNFIRILERIEPSEYAVLHRSMFPFNYDRPDDDGQPTEAQEWSDYDPYC